MFRVDIDGLEDLLWHGLQDYANAQAQLASTLDGLCAPRHEGLQAEIDDTSLAVAAELKAIRSILEDKPNPHELGDTDCRPMAELLCEINKFAKPSDIEPEVRDAGLLAAFQAVVHWEIARLGTLRSYADDLGHAKLADIITGILEARGKLDRNLTRLAETTINFRAADH